MHKTGQFGTLRYGIGVVGTHQAVFGENRHLLEGRKKTEQLALLDGIAIPIVHVENGKRVLVFRENATSVDESVFEKPRINNSEFSRWVPKLLEFRTASI